MIIHYDFLEKVIKQGLENGNKDIKIFSLHLSFFDHFKVQSSFEYKKLRFHLNGEFDLDIDEYIHIKNIQGTIQTFLFKKDLYSFLKEIIKKNEWILFENKNLIFLFDSINLRIKEVNSDSIYLDIND